MQVKATAEQIYQELLRAHDSIVSHLEADPKNTIFLMNVDPNALFTEFLNSVDSDRQHYNCITCRRWFTIWGSAVFINSETMQPVSLAWDWVSEIPEVNDVLEKFRNLINNAHVQGALEAMPHLPKEKGGFEHFHTPEKVHELVHIEILTPGDWKRHERKVKLTSTEMPSGGAFAQRINTLVAMLDRHKPEYFTTARELFDFDQRLAQRQNHLFPIENWEKVYNNIMSRTGKERQWALWYYSTTNVHVFNRTVAENFLAGMYPKNTDNAISILLSQTDPTEYKRALSDAGQQLIEEARAYFEQEGLNASLKFVPAEPDFEHLRWVTKFGPTEEQPAAEPVDDSADPFGTLLKNTDAPKVESSLEIDGGSIIYRDFLKDVLPKAQAMWVQYHHRPAHFHGVLRMQNPESAPILSTDRPDNRMPYYSITFNNPIRAEDWGITVPNNGRLRVMGILNSPTLQPSELEGGFAHLFVFDTGRFMELNGNPLLPEMVRSDLDRYRRVISQYNNTQKMPGAERSLVGCVAPMSRVQPGVFTVFVKMESGSVVKYNISSF